MNSLMLMHRVENPLRSDTFHIAVYAAHPPHNPLGTNGGSAS